MRRREKIYWRDWSSDGCSSDLAAGQGGALYRVGRGGTLLHDGARVLGLLAGWGSSGCFFFQAEDGIRDIGVTGVQTCALPISSRSLLASALGDRFLALLAEAARPGKL